MIASGSLMNSHIVADSNAPVIWYPTQSRIVNTANVIMIPNIEISPY